MDHHDSNLPSIAEEFVEAMDEVTDTRVQLQEISDLFLFRIEIDPSTDAARRIEKVLGAALPTTRGQVTGDATALHLLYGTRQVVACLYVEEGVYLVVTRVDAVKLGRALAAALGRDEGLVLDVSVNRTVLNLSGVAAADVIDEVVHFDFPPDFFDPGKALSCTVAEARIMLWRIDELEYLMVPRASDTAPFLVNILDACEKVK
ncbi:sarcosine oxidase subunit gamma family protein [Rothia nasimurium]|uniref:sarcosine oxidase subunit gamma family protein n=1 Tax=Rothia nasimurium TaxID=85336 RepID=UPI001F242036|nr:sarcosine oxidase subunit gamma family protein [Rothia nasimurium]